MKQNPKQKASITLTQEQANSYILYKQHLREDAHSDNLLQVTEDLVGLHATEPLSPYLSLFARMKKFQRKSLDDALSEKRQLGKVRFVRNTVFVLPRDMLPIAFVGLRQSLGKRVFEYLEQRGITCQDYEKYSAQILEVLSGTGKSAREIKTVLGVQASLSAVINVMCDQGLLIRGLPKTGWKSNQHIYFRMQDFFPNLDVQRDTDEEAKKSIVKRYITAYGPVTERDISWWTRFPKAEINQILVSLKPDITQVEIESLEKNFLMRSVDLDKMNSLKRIGKAQVNVLPMLDPYLMGYKDRDRMLDSQFYDYVYDRSGNATSSILVNGRIIGVWDYSKDSQTEIRWFLFQPLPRSLCTSIESKLRAMGKFIAERPVHLHRCDSMVPLPQRTAGSFMSPLRA